MDHPRTIKELVNEAHNYEYSTSVPLKVYLRTAETLSRHVCNYSGCVIITFTNYET